MCAPLWTCLICLPVQITHLTRHTCQSLLMLHSVWVSGVKKKAFRTRTDRGARGKHDIISHNKSDGGCKLPPDVIKSQTELITLPLPQFAHCIHSQLPHCDWVNCKGIDSCHKRPGSAAVIHFPASSVWVVTASWSRGTHQGCSTSFSDNFSFNISFTGAFW